MRPRVLGPKRSLGVWNLRCAAASVNVMNHARFFVEQLKTSPNGQSKPLDPLRAILDQTSFPTSFSQRAAKTRSLHIHPALPRTMHHASKPKPTA